MIEDFDIFTSEINLTKSSYKNMLKELVFNAPETPNTCNYETGRKLLAQECLADNDEAQCVFHISEAVSASVRYLAEYREDQREMAADKFKKMFSYSAPEQDMLNRNPLSEQNKALLKRLTGVDDVTFLTESLEKCKITEEMPFHRRYMKFSKENNIKNLHKILEELPKEWTIVQLTSPYNPNENFKRITEYQTEIDSIYLSVFTNDYMDVCGLGPFIVNIPANVTKLGLKPLFVELYSLLDQNYKNLENANFINSKKLVKNYWERREDVDLRMKSVINVMDKEWLGGWSALLTGRLVDTSLKRRVVAAVDHAIDDWGFIKLTNKQKLLLYNLIESCTNMTSKQIHSCTRKILTENGNVEELRQALDPCSNCTKEFKLSNEVCLKCLSSCFEKIHHFSLKDGIWAFSQVASKVKDGAEFAELKNAERHPVILIVDEMLDVFPWESLPALNQQPVSRVENIHLLYHMYKQHESDVIDGYFTTKAHDGRYVINPENNLDRMEKRMKSFVQYWLSGWKGHIRAPPPPNLYIDYLTSADIFLYCGHGDGCQLAQDGGGAGVESACGARAVCLLSGCGSARLVLAPRAPPHAAHRRLHRAGCPCVVGMLWEVTDLEVDKVVCSLLSLCVPSDAGTPWQRVAKDKWTQGIIETATQVESQDHQREPNLLKAIASSRAASKFLMISSSVVARGLPVKIRGKKVKAIFIKRQLPPKLATL